jgi:dTDP-4-amino-4,6-dideoxygalactose transaminase
MKTIDIGTLNITKRHIAKVVEALKSNRLSYGPMTDEFEKRFSKMHGNKYGVFTNSGTSALQATIHAMKILYGWKDGDEIIMPATTFVATYNVILQNNMKPVLVDIGKDLNIDVKLIKDKLTKKTRAILPVHLLGKSCDMKAIMKLAKIHKLKVIEDSCETMGVPGIGLGDVTCFSFYIAHILITGVGGIAITKDKKLADLIRSLIFHGRDNKYLSIDNDDKYDEEIIHSRFKFNHPGYSYRGTELEAALGLVELKLLNKNIRKRQKNAQYLNSKLNSQWSQSYLENHAFMMFPLTVERRNELILELEKNGITTRTIMPLINQPYIKVKQSDYPTSKYILEAGLLVGCHQDLNKKDLDKMVEIIRKYDR